MEKQQITPELDQEERRALLARFVLGTDAYIPKGYGVAEIDSFQRSAPDPREYPKDAP